jgi:hypothetical protein
VHSAQFGFRSWHARPLKSSKPVPFGPNGRKENFSGLRVSALRSFFRVVTGLGMKPLCTVIGREVLCPVSRRVSPPAARFSWSSLAAKPRTRTSSTPSRATSTTTTHSGAGVLELVLCFRFERRDGLFDLFLQASLLGLGLLQSIGCETAPGCPFQLVIARSKTSHSHQFYTEQSNLDHFRRFLSSSCAFALSAATVFLTSSCRRPCSALACSLARLYPRTRTS